MGVVMYQMLAGRPPFEAETYAALVLMVGNEPPAPFHVPVPPGLRDIVLRCLEKDPKNRIQNVGDLAKQLAPYASDPLSAQQSADRAIRILAARASQPAYPQLARSSAAGLGLTPPALTPKSWNHTNGSSLSGSAGQVGTQMVRSGRGKVIALVAGLCVAAGVGGFLIASGRTDKSTHVAAPAQQPTEVKATTVSTTPDTTAPTTPNPVTDTAKTATPGTATPGPATSATSDTAKTDAAKNDTAKTNATKTASDPAKTDASKSATDTAKADASKTASKTDAAKTDTAKTETTKTVAKTDTAKSQTTKTAAKSASHSTSHATHSTHTTHTTHTTKKDDDLFDDRH
jgi:hypothetical protein